MLRISDNADIIIDGHFTGLKIAQRLTGTCVYTPQDVGQQYRLHQLPHPRYATSHDRPASGVPGVAQLEADVRALLAGALDGRQ